MNALILALAALCYAPGQTAATINDARADRQVPTTGVRAAELPPIGPPTWPTPPQADPLRPAVEWVTSHVFELGTAWAFAFGMLGGYVALRRESKVGEGIALGAVFGPLGVLLALFLPPPLPASWRRNA